MCFIAIYIYPYNYLQYREKDKMYCMEPYTYNMTRILSGKYDFYGQGTLNYML